MRSQMCVMAAPRTHIDVLHVLCFRLLAISPFLFVAEGVRSDSLLLIRRKHVWLARLWRRATDPGTLPSPQPILHVFVGDLACEKVHLTEREREWHTHARTRVRSQPHANKSRTPSSRRRRASISASARSRVPGGKGGYWKLRSARPRRGEGGTLWDSAVGWVGAWVFCVVGAAVL